MSEFNNAAYRQAWEKLRMYVEGLPNMLALMPMPPEMLMRMESEGMAKSMELVHNGVFKQVLDLMKEQERELDLPKSELADDTELINTFLKSVSRPPKPTIPISEQPPMDKKDAELIVATKQAVIAAYVTMATMGARRAMTVIPAKENPEVGIPMGCLYVLGGEEIDKLLEYAQASHSCVHDSRDNDTVGEN